MARYIDADALSLEVRRYLMPNVDADGTVQVEDAERYFLNRIDKQPTADVEEVRHGQWLPQIVSGVKAWDCSECKTLGSAHWKRCPVCEAKMDGGK